jgi:hypothetical protein
MLNNNINNVEKRPKQHDTPAHPKKQKRWQRVLSCIIDAILDIVGQF